MASAEDLLPLLQDLPVERGAPRPGERLVVALSGGADSIAMADLLLRLREQRHLTLLAAHLDHGLREDSAQDVELCRRFCEQHDLEFISEKVDLPALATECGTGLEAAGRFARYRFLDRLRQERGFDVVATGHHRDDHVETLLLWLFRGTGPAGMEGIRARSEVRLRPLREFTRAQLRAYLKWRGLSWREDSTNALPTARRNRIRHELLPLIEDIFGPGADQRLSEFAERTSEAARWLTSLAQEQRQVLRRTLPGPKVEGETLDRVGFAGLDKPLQMEILRLIGRELERPGPQHWDQKGLQRLRSFALTGAAGKRHPLPTGGWLRTDRKYLRFIPPETEDPAGEGHLRVEFLPAGDDMVTMDAETQVCLDADKVRGSLQLRTFRAGDRIEVAGLPGRKKLAELYRETGIPADQRDSMWVVEDDEGIVWAVGVTPSRRCRVTDTTNRVVRLSFTSRMKDSDRP